MPLQIKSTTELVYKGWAKWNGPKLAQNLANRESSPEELEPLQLLGVLRIRRSAISMKP